MAAGALVYVMGPSGAGKDSLIQYARRKLAASQPVLFAHRYITRPPGEDIENYVSLSPAEFAQRAGHGLFAFSWSAYGFDYGVGVEIHAWRNAGFAVVVDGSRAHFARHADALGDAVPVLITASAETLRCRLTRRGREDAAAIERRVQRAAEIPVAHRALVTIDNSGTLEEGGDRLTEILIDCAQRR